MKNFLGMKIFVDIFRGHLGSSLRLKKKMRVPPPPPLVTNRLHFLAKLIIAFPDIVSHIMVITMVIKCHIKRFDAWPA